LAHLRQEANEKKLAKILDAVIELRETTENRLGTLRDKLNDFLAEGIQH
jgi:hypothetical protein